MDDDVRAEAGAPRWLVVSVVASLVVVAAFAGFVVGDRDDRPGAGSVDVGFLQDMLAHHEQALSLSAMEISSGSEERIRSFAVEITRDQSYEMGLMEQRLADWGHPREAATPTAMRWMGQPVSREVMPGLANEDELAALQTAEGRDADALFVALMKDHHAGGVHMAEHAASHASDRFVRDLAARMAGKQRVEIAEMAQAQRAAGLPAAPAGWVPDPITKALAATPTTGGHHP